MDYRRNIAGLGRTNLTRFQAQRISPLRVQSPWGAGSEEKAGPPNGPGLFAFLVHGLRLGAAARRPHKAAIPTQAFFNGWEGEAPAELAFTRLIGQSQRELSPPIHSHSGGPLPKQVGSL